MQTLHDALLQVFASFSTAEGELARQVQYLKVENEILRSKLPDRMQLTARERTRLLKYGKSVGPTIDHLISIVTPATFERWLQAEARAAQRRHRKSGRPRIG